MIRRMVAAAIVSVAAISVAAIAPAPAQSWPTRPINLLVPYAAGGPVDTIARILCARMSETLGQQLVIENVGGAGGMTGSQRVAKSPPDGYSLLLSGSAVLTINQSLYKRPLYNGTTDFDHVVLHSDSARILITRPDFPAKSLAEFVAYAKANQGKMQYGSAGAGSGSHVCAVLLDVAMGTKVAHIPYRGAGPAMQDLIAGRVDYMAEQISTALPQIQGGKVKALATFGLDRAPGLERSRHRRRAGTERSRLRLLGLVLVPERHARRHRAAAGASVQRGGRVADGARPLQGDRRGGAVEGAPHAGISAQVRRHRNRALGGADQEQRRGDRLTTLATADHPGRRCAGSKS